MQYNCLMGNDVGAYNSCMHLCKYCYANANQGLVLVLFSYIKYKL